MGEKSIYYHPEYHQPCNELYSLGSDEDRYKYLMEKSQAHRFESEEEARSIAASAIQDEMSRLTAIKNEWTNTWVCYEGILRQVGNVPEHLSVDDPDDRTLLRLGTIILNEVQKEFIARINIAAQEQASERLAYADTVEKLAAIVFLNNKCRETLDRKNNEEKGKLEGFMSPEAKIARAAALDDEIRLSFESEPEDSSINRRELTKSAMDQLSVFTKGKLNQQANPFLEQIRQRGVRFLGDDDYHVLETSLAGRRQTTSALTYYDGLIVTSMESLRKTLRTADIATPDIVEQNQTTFSITDISELLERYNSTMMPYLIKQIGKSKRNPTGISAKELEAEPSPDVIENVEWAIIFHEGLHVSTAPNCLRTELDEAATYYYTAVNLLKSRGNRAFVEYIEYCGLSPVLTWIEFIRESGIDEKQAEIMYFNTDGSWNDEKIKSSLPSGVYNKFFSNK